MQQKLQKMRKARRSHLKGYTMHRGNRKPPNKDVIKEYKERAKGIGIDEVFIDAHMRAFWPDHNPERRNSPGRIEALHKAQILRDAQNAIEEVERCVEVFANERRAMHLYFARGNGPAFFIERDFILGRFRRSEEYRDANSARTHYQMRAIRWYEYRPIPP